jgi:hypothetical protein
MLAFLKNNITNILAGAGAAGGLGALGTGLAELLTGGD